MHLLFCAALGCHTAFPKHRRICLAPGGWSGHVAERPSEANLTWGQGGWAKASEQGVEGKYGRSLPPCFQSLSPFIISSLGCSWLPLPTLGCCLPPCLPSLSLFMISFLGCSWLPLLRCLPSLSPFMISLLGCSWLPLPPWSMSPFMISLLGCSWLLPLPSLSPFMISLVGCSWLPLPSCVPSLSAFMVSLLVCSWLPLLQIWCPPWAALGCSCRLGFQACLPSGIPFSAALLLVPVASCFCFCGVAGSHLFVVCCLFLSQGLMLPLLIRRCLSRQTQV